jgi:DNA-binding MarR family transcriptional regulator
MKNRLTAGFVAYTTFAMAIDRLNPKDSLGFLTWKVSRILTNCLAARFASGGIPVTVEQWRALLPLYKHDGLSQGKLCEVLSQEKTGVSRLLAALERRGLVRRESGEGDRRVKHIFITEAGRRLVDETIPMALESRDACCANITPADLEVCKRVLWQIIEPVFDHECLALGGDDQ